MKKEYFAKLGHVDKKDIVRNITGKIYSYKYDNTRRYYYRSYYGDIHHCYASTKVLEL